jgi:hypothetical protein
VDGTSLLSTTVAEFRFEAGRWQIEIGIRYKEREINSGNLRAGRAVCGTVITVDTAFWQCLVLLLISPIFYTCSSISPTSFTYYRLLPFPLFIPLCISVLHSLPLHPLPPVIISFYPQLLLPHPSCFFYPSVYLSSLP